MMIAAKGITWRCAVAAVAFLAIAGAPGVAFAQRDLRWQRVDVDATLDATGTLHIIETQAMVFNGDWNGGERTFNIRPWQTLHLGGVERQQSGGWHALTLDSDLDDVDDYGWTDDTTLRWRSRLPSDPPFRETVLTYRLDYSLSGILLSTDDGYTLDHDFLFPDRAGFVDRFTLRLTLAPEWSSPLPVQREYRAGGLSPGYGYVLTLPLKYSGAEPPEARPAGRPREIAVTTWALLGLSALLVGWFFAREHWYGRFDTVDGEVDEAWLEKNILNIPAEVVGAAWDQSITASEVVALIARMTAEGKLASTVSGKSMTLRFNVARESLDAHERTLVDGLFFNGRTTTNKELVAQHYRKTGYDPAKEISPELQARVEGILPAGRTPARFSFLFHLLWLGGLTLLAWEYFNGNVGGAPAWLSAGLLVVLMLIGVAAGLEFRSQIHWGGKNAWACLAPGFIGVGVVAVLLWFYVGPTAAIVASNNFGFAVAALALGVLGVTAETMKSRQHRAAIAFRKRLGAARLFFERELATPYPALRDEWTPWLLAFGLGKNIDDWSAKHVQVSSSGRSQSYSSSSSSDYSGSSASSRSSWTGFSGGRSGGAGASGSWAAAAGGLAAGVSPPSSSGSGGSGGGSSSGGSSSGGSSGGGGGGGW